MREWLDRMWLDRMWRQRQAAGLVVLAVVWLPAADAWWLGPRRTELGQRREALAQLREEIAATRQAPARLAAVEAELAALEARVGGAGAAGRAAGDSASLLRRVELLASGTGLRIRGFTPQPALVHELHAEWPSRLELSGSFHELLAFLERLADCAADVVVGNLEVRAADAADTGAAVTVACTVTALGFNAATDAGPARAVDTACAPAAAGGVADAGAAAAAVDPFSRLAPAADPLPATARVPGLPGLRVGELTLQGLVRTGGGPLAVVAAPDGETYLLRGGEQLLDGTVAAVHADAVVFREYGAGAARETRRTLADAVDGR